MCGFQSVGLPDVQCFALLQLLLVQPYVSFWSFTMPLYQVLSSLAPLSFVDDLVHSELHISVDVDWSWWVEGTVGEEGVVIL
jgi:hypothetical protein